MFGAWGCLRPTVWCVVNCLNKLGGQLYGVLSSHYLTLQASLQIIFAVGIFCQVCQLEGLAGPARHQWGD